MELVVTTTLFISLVLSIQPSAALQNQVSLSLSHDEQAHNQLLFPLPKLPRKLLLLEEVTVQKHGGQHTILYNQKEDISGKHKHGEQKVMHGSKGTWQEWMEGKDNSHFFTMDYTHVKRRRPIHNKSLPVVP